MNRLVWGLLTATWLAACVGDVTSAPDSGPGQDATTNDGASGDGGGGDATLGVPAHAPSSIAFTDEDPTVSNAAGTVTIGKAADESDITSYKLYWGVAAAGDGGADGGAPSKLLLLADLPKTGSAVTYALKAAIPTGATYLIAVSSNASGEMADGPATTPIDNFPVHTDISADAGAGIRFPSAAIDTVNQKLIVATDGPSPGLGLFVCDLDGSGCVYRGVGAALGLGTNTGTFPSVVVDATNKKLLVAAIQQGNPNHLLLYRCDLDGTNCSMMDVSTATGQTFSANFPTAMFDATDDKLYIAVENYGYERPGVFRCINVPQSDAGVVSCSYVDLATLTVSDAGAGNHTGHEPSGFFANNKVYVAASNTNQFKPQLFICDALNWPACTTADISAGAGQYSAGGVGVNAQAVSAAFDSTNGKVLTVTYDGTLNGHPGLFRCDSAGANCTHSDLSGMALDAGASTGYYPHAVVDTAHGKLYVATQDNDNGQKPSVFRCALDGTACTRIDVSAGQGPGSASELTAVLDSANKRILVVTDDGTNTSRPALFSLGVW